MNREGLRKILRGKCVTDEACEAAIDELLNLHSVSERLPVKCTRLSDDNELDDGWELSVESAGELITEQSKTIKFFRDFIDEYNSNYR